MAKILLQPLRRLLISSPRIIPRNVLLSHFKSCLAVSFAASMLSSRSFASKRRGYSKGRYHTTKSGLQYEDVKEGEGVSPQYGDIVQVHYTGTLADGSKFDSSYDRGEPISFPVGTGRVIQGWDEGIMTMKVGGIRKLVIPPELGYGSNGIGSIPPNSILYFDCELVGMGPPESIFTRVKKFFFS